MQHVEMKTVQLHSVNFSLDNVQGGVIWYDDDDSNDDEGGGGEGGGGGGDDGSAQIPRR